MGQGNGEGIACMFEVIFWDEGDIPPLGSGLLGGRREQDAWSHARASDYRGARAPSSDCTCGIRLRL